MWLPYLERLGLPFVVVVRSVANFREVSKITNRPILYRRSMEDLDVLMTPSLRGVFYTNGAIRNAHMTRYPQVKHIQLNHGESDKAPSVNPVIRMFDLDFVAGQAAIDRFAANGVNMPLQMFRIVGRPQVESVKLREMPISEIAAPTVLYAPTWRGYHKDAQYSSLLLGFKIVSALVERGCTVVFRPHPYSYKDASLRAACRKIKKFLREDARQTGRAHVCGHAAEDDMSVTDCFNLSDAMISDVSSVVGDYLFSHKPFAMVSTRTDTDIFRREFPMSRAAYVIEGRGKRVLNLEETLDGLLGDDPMAEERIGLATYYLGDIPREYYVDHFVAVARNELGFEAGE